MSPLSCIFFFSVSLYKSKSVVSNMEWTLCKILSELTPPTARLPCRRRRVEVEGPTSLSWHHRRRKKRISLVSKVILREDVTSHRDVTPSFSAVTLPLQRPSNTSRQSRRDTCVASLLWSDVTTNYQVRKLNLSIIGAEKQLVRDRREEMGFRS